MKIEFERQDVEAIAQRVLELIRPLFSGKPDKQDSIFDVQGLSQYLGIPHSWIYKKVSLKEIPYFKVGRYVRFRKTAIDRWTQNQTVNPIPALRHVQKYQATS